MDRTRLKKIIQDLTLRKRNVCRAAHGWCHTWLGRLSTGGYPILTFQGKVLYVRRMVWLLYRGHLPRKNGRELEIRTTCGHRLCVNPDHLVAGKRTKGGRPSAITNDQLE